MGDLGRMREERLRSCGKKGQVSRTILRDWVRGREPDWKKARKAVWHVEECPYCQTQIDLAIKGAEREGHRTDYLESTSATLLEARRKFPAIIRGERSF